MVYPALLPLLRTPWLPVVDWTDAPADLNGLVRFAERRNLVSARAPSHFKRTIHILYFSTASRPAMRPNQLYIQWAWGVLFFSLKVRWLVCDGNHCTLLRAKGKDAWSYTFISSCLYLTVFDQALRTLISEFTLKIHFNISTLQFHGLVFTPPTPTPKQTSELHSPINLVY
jgi:hypothetical protein